MKVGYFPAPRTKPAEIAKRRQAIDEIARRVETLAHESLAGALQRHSGRDGAELVLIDAKSILKSIVAGENNELIESASQPLSESLARALQENPLDDQVSTQKWLREKSKDLARSMAVFWLGLGKENAARYAAAQGIIQAMDGKSQNELLEKFKVTHFSYGLDAAEAENLLMGLSIGEFTRSAVKEIFPEDPIAEELTGSILATIADVPNRPESQKASTDISPADRPASQQRKAEHDAAYALRVNPYIDAMRAALGNVTMKRYSVVAYKASPGKVRKGTKRSSKRKYDIVLWMGVDSYRKVKTPGAVLLRVKDKADLIRRMQPGKRVFLIDGAVVNTKKLESELGHAAQEAKLVDTIAKIIATPEVSTRKAPELNTRRALVRH